MFNKLRAAIRAIMEPVDNWDSLPEATGITRIPITDLEQRRRIGHMERRASPGFGWCGRCHRPWSHVQYNHRAVTEYDDRGFGTNGCFCLCDTCWDETTPDERCAYFEVSRLNYWPTFTADQLRKAVLKASGVV